MERNDGEGRAILAMKKTQREWVEQQLKEKGAISRNTCLRNYISRLGAIICDMKADGWEFETKTVDGDYVYVLQNQPRKKVVEYVLEFKNGTPVRVPKVSWL